MKILLCLLLAAGLGVEEEEEVWDPALTDETLCSFFAWAMVSMGDLDGDGAGDFLVSSPRECPGWLVGGWDQVRGEGKFAGQPLPDFGVVRAISGADGRVLYGLSEPGRFGESLACLGDLDEDGKNDFAVGTSRDLPGYFVFSGADGSLLFSRAGEKGDPGGNCSLAAVGDVSGDGLRDLLIGWPNNTFLHGVERPPSHVEIVSGADGSPLLRIDSSRFEADHAGPGACVIGGRVWGLDDLDGDGKDEFAFTRQVGLEYPYRVSVVVANGDDGSILYEIEPERYSGGDGPAMAVIGDRDADGLPDWLEGSSASDFNIYEMDDLEPDGLPEEWWQPQGEVVAHSSASGEPLFSLGPEKRSPRFGHALAGGADFDADGVPDVIVTDYGGEVTFKGFCYVYSGADGSLVRKHEGKATWDYGASLIVVDDLDGDDCADYVVGCMRDYPGQNGNGFAMVYSGRTGEMKYFLGGRNRP